MFFYLVLERHGEKDKVAKQLREIKLTLCHLQQVSCLEAHYEVPAMFVDLLGDLLQVKDIALLQSNLLQWLWAGEEPSDDDESLVAFVNHWQPQSDTRPSAQQQAIGAQVSSGDPRWKLEYDAGKDYTTRAVDAGDANKTALANASLNEAGSTNDVSTSYR